MPEKATKKIKRQLMAARQQAFVVADLEEEQGYALRLAEGEAWDAGAVSLAMLMSGKSYINKIDFGETDTCACRRMCQATLRRNSFTPECEPSRHEMRIFDALDGLVTEM
ncbi:MAG: hypothetical protein C0613_02435 [Desulfobulbaceae bacterium]|nr:MAG: hypothetical protein C0613_02435 [Desulfobulbaceae bacterium]